MHDHRLIGETRASAKGPRLDGIQIIGFAAADPAYQGPHGKLLKIGRVDGKTKMHRCPKRQNNHGKTVVWRFRKNTVNGVFIVILAGDGFCVCGT